MRLHIAIALSAVALLAACQPPAPPPAQRISCLALSDPAQFAGQRVKVRGRQQVTQTRATADGVMTITRLWSCVDVGDSEASGVMFFTGVTGTASGGRDPGGETWLDGTSERLAQIRDLDITGIARDVRTHTFAGPGLTDQEISGLYIESAEISYAADDTGAAVPAEDPAAAVDVAADPPAPPAADDNAPPVDTQ